MVRLARKRMKAPALEAAQLRLELLGLPCIRVRQPIAAQGKRMIESADSETAAAEAAAARSSCNTHDGQQCAPPQRVRHQLQHIHPGRKDQHLQQCAELSAGPDG